MLRAEQYRSKPVPEQLFRLASVVICLAGQQGKIIQSKRANNAHIFLPNEIETDIIREQECARINQKIIGRIARTGYRQWSMRLAEPYWVSADQKDDDGYRVTYAFEWNQKEAVTARKHMKTKVCDDIEDYESVLMPVLDVDMLQPDFLHAQLQCELVSYGDCDQLISKAQEFSQTSQTSKRYNR